MVYNIEKQRKELQKYDRNKNYVRYGWNLGRFVRS